WSSSFHNLEMDQSDGGGSGSVEVRQIDFMRYLEDLNEDIGILKIDIEGAEVELLEALFDRPDILKRIAFIFAETHERLYANHKPRVKALRERAKRLEQTRVDLDWH
ncbi:MAG: FkbM family methyltransferase, partial [Alphaproteobacteria bacterium]|nr:FkbM family methyltransferase [Alphaproteobacteria bacterium]